MEMELVDYDPMWPTIFIKERDRILDSLKDLNPEIHHIGSTAIPGLMAKPIVDIMALVPSIDDERELSSKLSAAEYKFIKRIANRLFFGKGLDANPMCNLHVFADNDKSAKACVKFRDYLQRHSDKRAEYERLKQVLIVEFPDNIEEYSAGKTQFIMNVLSKAGSE